MLQADIGLQYENWTAHHVSTRSMSLMTDTPALWAQRVRSNGALVVVFAAVYAIGFGIVIWSPSGLSRPSLVFAGAVLFLLSCTAFIRQGGTSINGSAIASYSLALFGAFPAIYIGLGLYPPEASASIQSLWAATTMCFVLQSVLLCCSPRRAVDIQRPTRTDSSPVLRVTASAVLLLAAISLNPLGVATLSQSLGVIAIVLIADATFSRSSVKATIVMAALLAAYCYLFAEFLFSGFGRLVLGMLGCAIVMVASLYLRSVLIKYGTLLVTVPAIVFLSIQRLAFLSTTRVYPVSASEGIGSIVGPLGSFAKIIQAMWEGWLHPSYGSSFFATAVIWVPRWIWSDKPAGFGQEMARVTAPGMLAAVPSYSDASTLGGELVWNAGLFFWVVLAIAIGFALSALDAAVHRLNNQGFPGQDFQSMIKRAIVVILAASVIHLTWGGTFIFASRVLGPVAILLAAWAIITMLRRWAGPRGRLLEFRRKASTKGAS
jgi:hypothetical protein